MVDDARRHEERSLERRVIEYVEDACHDGQRAIHTEEQRYQTQMADGGIGEQALEVVLEDRKVGAHQQGRQPRQADEPEPRVRVAERRVHARQKEHAGLHHRGGVQVSRHGRRRCHRVRQPEVERELRTFGKRAQQHQHQGRQIQRMGADRVAGCQDRIELEAANDVPEQQHAAQQCEASCAGDRQRHARALAGIGAMVPVADQQERGEAGGLPENHQQQQVVCQDQPQHGAHEEQQVTKEARRRIIRMQVIGGIEHDQRADGADQQREHPRQPVDAETERQAKRRQPVNRPAQHLAAKDLRRRGQHQRERGQRDDAGHPGGDVPTLVRHQTKQRGSGEGQQREQQQLHAAGRGLRTSTTISVMTVSGMTKLIIAVENGSSAACFWAARTR